MSVFGLSTISDDNGSATADRSTDQQRLALIRDLGAVGTFHFDMASRSIRWRHSAWRPLGQEAGTIPLDDLMPLLVDDCAGSIVTLILAAAADRDHDVTVNCDLRSPGMGRRRIEARATIHYDDAGAIVALDGVMRDVTIDHRREQMLVAQGVEMAAILAGVPDAIVIVNRVGIVTRFNPAAVRLFGHADDAVIGRPFADLMATDIGAAGDGAEARTIATRHADGRPLTVELRIVAMTDGDDHGDLAGGRILFIRDISDRTAIEARLAAARRQFAQATRVNVIGGFAAYLAHEVTQPLCAIGNYIGAARALADTGRNPQELAGMLTSADRQAERARTIVRRLYDLTSRGEVESRSVEIEPAFQAATELTLAEIGRDKADIRFVLDPTIPTMLVDPVQIQQVLVNLLRNAAQAPRDADAARTISILTQPAIDGMVEISVCDDGPGFPPAAMADLFQPFGPGSGGGSRGGMGLGLSICRAIVEAHGGTIHAVNQPTGGACVRFTVPGAEPGAAG